MPLLLGLRVVRVTERGDLGQLLLAIRRVTIIVIVLLGYLYFRLIGQSTSLVSIGLISFAAVAQFAPAILGGIYWKGGTRLGALSGLLGGFVIWGYTLPLPSFAEAGGLSMEFVEAGLGGISLLRPYALLGLTGLDPISHALFWSMVINGGLYVVVSLVGRQSVREHGQATLFVDVATYAASGDTLPLWRGTAAVASLRNLLARFLGDQRAAGALASYARQHGLDLSTMAAADAELVQHAERLLAGSIGAASARVAIASVVKEEALTLHEVMRMLDETSQMIAYSHQLEQRSRQLEEKTLALEAASAKLRAANARLQELDRLKDDFISTVTHELRTPLTSIRAFSEILHDNPDLDMIQRTNFLEIILKESERLTRLINQVLDLAKLESGAAEWAADEVVLAELIQDVLASTSGLMRDKGITLQVALPAQSPTILADRDRITQVLLNLLSNAIKFCKADGGQIQVALAQQNGNLQVTVADNGAGISRQEQAVIFDKFRQVNDSTAGKPQGTGLGLPISMQIISHYGGELWVESEPGAGATFRFTLPAHAELISNGNTS
jgi:signal transduction histidine kinase